MPTAATPTPLRDQLRHATAAAHAALEATALMHAVADGVPNPAAYGAYLQGHWQVHAALEPRLAASLPPAWTAGRLEKSAWLQADLLALGAVAGAAPVAAGAFLSEAEALGAMYVLEGATLGLGVVRRRLPPTHPACQGAGRFMAGYGEESGARWSAFLRLLAERRACDGPPACAAALATFDLYLRLFSVWPAPQARA